MASMYNKLFTRILDSSIWLESDATRLVWLTLLAAMDEDGFAQFAAVANLAHRARVSLEDAKAAVATLESPDPESSDQSNEGRRIERVPGGWIVLNSRKYREIVTREVAREHGRERVRRYRERLKCNADVTPANDSVTTSEASASADPAGSPSLDLPSEDLEKPAASRSRKPLSQQDGLVGELASAWADEHHGAEPTWGREVVGVHKLAKQHGEDEVRQAWRRYLAESDPFFAGHPIKHFVSQFDRFRFPAPPPKRKGWQPPNFANEDYTGPEFEERRRP